MTIDDVKQQLAQRIQELEGGIMQERMLRDSEKEQQERLKTSIPARDKHIDAMATALAECRQLLGRINQGADAAAVEAVAAKNGDGKAEAKKAA